LNLKFSRPRETAHRTATFHPDEGRRLATANGGNGGINSRTRQLRRTAVIGPKAGIGAVYRSSTGIAGGENAVVPVPAMPEHRDRAFVYETTGQGRPRGSCAIGGSQVFALARLPSGFDISPRSDIPAAVITAFHPIERI